MGWKRSSCAVLVAAAALAVHAADSRLAKIASVQNAVESRRAGGASWSAAKVDEPLAAGDRVRTGPASRAAILYADDTLHRLAEKSEVEIVARRNEVAPRQAGEVWSNCALYEQDCLVTTSIVVHTVQHAQRVPRARPRVVGEELHERSMKLPGIGQVSPDVT